MFLPNSEPSTRPKPPTRMFAVGAYRLPPTCRVIAPTPPICDVITPGRERQLRANANADDDVEVVWTEPDRSVVVVVAGGVDQRWYIDDLFESARAGCLDAHRFGVLLSADVDERDASKSSPGRHVEVAADADAPDRSHRPGEICVALHVHDAGHVERRIDSQILACVQKASEQHVLCTGYREAAADIGVACRDVVAIHSDAASELLGRIGAIAGAEAARPQVSRDARVLAAAQRGREGLGGYARRAGVAEGYLVLRHPKLPAGLLLVGRRLPRRSSAGSRRRRELNYCCPLSCADEQ